METATGETDEASEDGFDLSETGGRREYLAWLRQECVRLSATDVSGIDICRRLSDGIDRLVLSVTEREIAASGHDLTDRMQVICVGGSGRQRPAPYSDLDLLIILDRDFPTECTDVPERIVRQLWDDGIHLGHSTRTPADVLRFAVEDIHFATSLADLRFLTGHEEGFRALHEQVLQKVFSNGTARFVERCVAARRDEWTVRGNSVNQLEPDVKKSPGGLRDLHLLRWVSLARYGDADHATLLEHGDIRISELAALTAADEFLTRLRLELHCRAGLKQDVLTRDLQLEIAPARGIVGATRRKAAEELMHGYFDHTSRVSEITRRVTEVQKSPTILSRIRSAIIPDKELQGFISSGGLLSATGPAVAEMRADPERILRPFLLAARRQLVLSADLRRDINRITDLLPAEPSREAAREFREILRCGAGMPEVIREMHETRVLEWLIPDFDAIRNLMQFNHYHSFTVDEHTLKAMDVVVELAEDETPVGTAYRSVRHKATLHLALLMHDVGKGFEGDHSIVGEDICERIGVRLQMAENKKRMLMFLVRHHLIMPDLAFRRDFTDPALLVEFSRLVGSPELLRMLYVLTVADVKAVGPDAWTDWKGELLAGLYARAMELISGRPYNHLEVDRLELVRNHVRAAVRPPADAAVTNDAASPSSDWIEQQLDALPAFYLMTEAPEQIATDLKDIRSLAADQVRVTGRYDPDTDTVNYRVIAAPAFEAGSFHRIAGVLSGLRMNILTAQTCSTAESTLIASYVVTDNDFVGTVHPSRITDVCQAVSDVLTGNTTVDSVFRRSGLFRLKRPQKPAAAVAPRVCVDNDCSENHTVIDVFANDFPGLLYTLGLTLYRNNLSVELTRIGTNVDQIVDVFYTVDRDTGGKVLDPERLENLVTELLDEVNRLQELYEEAN